MENFDEHYKHSKQFFYRASKITRSEEVTEDAVQDVFLKVWEKRSCLDPKRNILCAKSMRFLVFIFTICTFFEKEVYAQSFERFSMQIMDTLYFIDCKLPEEFIDLNQIETFWGNTGNPYLQKVLHMVYCPLIQSKDEQCVVMYTPSYNLLISANQQNVQHRYQIKGILTNMTGIDDNKFNKYVTVWSQRKSRNTFNADTVFVFNIPVPAVHAYKDIYTRCMAMFITKWGRAYITTIWFFTPNGHKNRKKYMVAFNKIIWYKEEWVLNKEKIRKTLWNGHCNDSRWE